MTWPSDGAGRSVPCHGGGWPLGCGTRRRKMSLGALAQIEEAENQRSPSLPARMANKGAAAQARRTRDAQRQPTPCCIVLDSWSWPLVWLSLAGLTERMMFTSQTFEQGATQYCHRDVSPTEIDPLTTTSKLHVSRVQGGSAHSPGRKQKL